MSYKLIKANDKKHKYIVILPNKKKIKFGAYGYSDYTRHKDKKRKENYDKRHKNREKWQDANTAGFWAKWLLWNKPTIKESKAYIKKKFKIKIN